MSINQEWVDRQQNSNADRRDYEYERLKVWALDTIHEAMDRNGQSKADLARSLGTSRANITQAFSGNRNTTLRTLSDLAWACGVRLCVKAEPLRTGDYISSPVHVVSPIKRVVTTEKAVRNDVLCGEDLQLLVAGCAS